MSLSRRQRDIVDKVLSWSQLTGRHPGCARQVDSFVVSGKPESGNPAAVVLEQGLGRVLTDSERRDIAAHLDQPVTAFVATTMVVSPTSVLPVCMKQHVIGYGQHMCVHHHVRHGGDRRYSVPCYTRNLGVHSRRAHVQGPHLLMCDVPSRHRSLRPILICKASAQFCRFYTPTGVELELCGHGTLAAAAVLHAHQGSIYSECFCSPY